MVYKRLQHVIYKWRLDKEAKKKRVWKYGKPSRAFTTFPHHSNNNEFIQLTKWIYCPKIGEYFRRRKSHGFLITFCSAPYWSHMAFPGCGSRKSRSVQTLYCGLCATIAIRLKPSCCSCSRIFSMLPGPISSIILSRTYSRCCVEASLISCASRYPTCCRTNGVYYQLPTA